MSSNERTAKYSSPPRLVTHATGAYPVGAQPAMPAPEPPPFWNDTVRVHNRTTFDTQVHDLAYAMVRGRLDEEATYQTVGRLLAELDVDLAAYVAEADREAGDA